MGLEPAGGWPHIHSHSKGCLPALVGCLRRKSPWLITFQTLAFSNEEKPGPGRSACPGSHSDVVAELDRDPKDPTAGSVPLCGGGILEGWQ